MKKTSIFNLGGNACYIDDDAADVLRNYLDELRRHFGDNPSTDEVMNDIEMRLWEIFNEHKRYGMQVVSMREVEEAMSILGKVDDFGTIGETTEQTDNKTAEETAQPDEPECEADNREYPEKDMIRKKLFRNPDDKVIGGVAAGLATYLDIQSVWARILFVLFFLFSGGIVLIIYLVLWIVMPQARTTAQRLEMQGIRPTAENIRHYVSKSVECGNLPTQNGNGCLQASAIGCGILILLPVIVLALLTLAMSIPIAWDALDELFHFGPAMHHLERGILPPGTLGDWVSTLMLNVLWLVPLLTVIFLFINRRWPQEPSTLRIVKIVALVLWLVALVWITVRVVWHII